MSVFKRRIPHKKRPSHETPLGGKYNNDLHSFIGFLERAGDPKDIANNIAISNTATTAYWGVDKYGVRYNRQGDVDGNAQLSLPSPPDYTGGALYLEYHIDTAVSGGRIWHSTSSALEGRKGFGSNDIIWIGGTSNNLSGFDLSSDGYHRALITWDSSGGTLYHNTADQHDINTQSLSVGTTAHGDYLGILAQRFGLSTLCDNTGEMGLYQVFVKNGKIPDAEARAIMRNPRIMYQPQTQLVHIPDAAGAYTLTADTGSYTQTGQDANLLLGRVVQADSGAYTYTGTDVNLLYGRLISAETGAYVYTGIDADLIYTPIGGYTLTADPGSYALTGVDVNLNYGRIMTADAGSYALTGVDASLNIGYYIGADAGSYAISGIDVNFLYGRALTAESGVYDYTGIDVNLVYSGRTGPDEPGLEYTMNDDKIHYTYSSDLIHYTFKAD